jgi:short chain dehydrogenase
MDLQLTEKIIVITGASSGIGRATALTVAAEGGIPIVVARSTDKLEKAKAEIEGAGGAAYVCTADVTDTAAPDRVIATVLEEYGRVDGLGEQRPQVPGLTHHLREDNDHVGHQCVLAGWCTPGGHRVHAVRGWRSADQRRRRTDYRADSRRISRSGTELVL